MPTAPTASDTPLGIRQQETIGKAAPGAPLSGSRHYVVAFRLRFGEPSASFMRDSRVFLVMTARRKVSTKRVRSILGKIVVCGHR